MLAHPVVHLLGVSVEELQVHALLVLLPAHLPQLQQGLLLLAQDLQLQPKKTDTSRVTTLVMVTSSAEGEDQSHLLLDLLGGVVTAGEQRLAGFIGGPEAVLMGVDLPLETQTHTRESGHRVCAC